MESTEIFENLEEEYSSLCLSIRNNIAQIPEFSGEQRKSYLRVTTKDLEEVYDILKQMDYEIRALKTDLREKLKTLYIKYKDEYQQLQTELRKASTTYNDQENQRLELFGDTEILLGSSKQSKEGLIKDTNNLRNTSNLIKEGHTTALEVEEIAEGVLEDLHTQRKTIENTKRNLETGDSNIDKNSRILSIMLRRKITNKIILVLVILFLLIVIFIVIYFAYIKKKN
ncbi:vesicle transport protein [Anaeramoeba flamelloides]|uniref:Vesicle transport protein n=1 Tax=Anaeramoeba flamelloides TaxID=1746091 RepID=A0ABQ8ZEW3_9EUKA|nr:vesicle transport protein [Anaeramoeba flamelloides]